MTTADADQPVIPGFHPDPTVCRVGEEYFLANSSFEYFPAAPLWRSRDLVDWSPVGNILTRRSQFPRGDGRPSGGIFGSTLRHHDGRFWFITTNMSEPGRGHLVVSAEDPAGPWSEPTYLDVLGIDPDLSWGPDGSCYLTWCGFTHGGGILQARVDLDTGALLEEPRTVWSGTGLAWPEGPHVYQHGDHWYLLIAEGGTERGHAVCVARADHLTGPFEPHPANPIFSHRSTAHPVQNVGHADLIERPDGSWAAVYLGVRPKGMTPAFSPLGRETFLASIDWVDGWPVFLGSVPTTVIPANAGIPTTTHAFVNIFDGQGLHSRWVVPAGEPERFATLREGGVELRREPSMDHDALLCTRIVDQAWQAEADVDLASGGARLVLRLDDRHWCAVEADADAVRARGQAGPFTQVLAEAAPPAGPVTLVISAAPASNANEMGANLGPDEVQLGYRAGDTVEVLARIDGRYFTTEVAGGFTGRVVGIGALAERTRVHAFRYTPRES